VVLAIVQGHRDGGAGTTRNRLGVDRATQPRGGSQPGQIGTESVAQIHHGAGDLMPRQPTALRQSWLEAEVMPRLRGAQTPGDVD